MKDIDELRRRIRIRDARPEDDQDPELAGEAEDGLVAEDDEDAADD